jgi:hypothetical protein
MGRHHHLESRSHQPHESRPRRRDESRPHHRDESSPLTVTSLVTAPCPPRVTTPWPHRRIGAEDCTAADSELPTRRVRVSDSDESESATNPSQRQFRVSDKSESATNPSQRQIRVRDKSGPARAWTGPATPRACGPCPPLWLSYGSAVLPVGAPWSRPHKELGTAPRWTPRWGHLVRTPQGGQPGSPAFAQGLRPMPRAVAQLSSRWGHRAPWAFKIAPLRRPVLRPKDTLDVSDTLDGYIQKMHWMYLRIDAATRINGWIDASARCAVRGDHWCAIRET